MRLTAVTGLVFALCLSGPLPAGAEPADATVFIRLTGHVRVLSGGDRIRREVLLDLPQVEVGTGSGFIVSSEGWVLTNHHVVTGAKLDAVIDGVAVVIAIEVERIEVVLPREGGSPGGASHRYVASVYASDPDLDLAVLSISAPELPVVSLGDSDVVAPGDAVTAIGYPFGSQLEIGKAQPSDAMPDVSVNAGSVSALRRNDAGDIRYLQTSAQLNPGNSGGPIVDADGYAVAVAQLAVEGGAGLGFGVPINLVKAYLRRLGLDRTLPDDLLTLGPHFDEDAKGVQLRIPDGFQDSSALRLRVEVGAYGNPVALRIDRLATPLPLDQMEKALLAGGTFEHFQAEGAARRTARRDESGRTVIAGYARGTDTAANRQAAMLYTLIDLGREKIVARYVGTAAAIAMNRSVFRDSLAATESETVAHRGGGLRQAGMDVGRGAAGGGRSLLHATRMGRRGRHAVRMHGSVGSHTGTLHLADGGLQDRVPRRTVGRSRHRRRTGGGSMCGREHGVGPGVLLYDPCGLVGDDLCRARGPEARGQWRALASRDDRARRRGRSGDAALRRVGEGERTAVIRHDAESAPRTVFKNAKGMCDTLLEEAHREETVVRSAQRRVGHQPRDGRAIDARVDSGRLAGRGSDDHRPWSPHDRIRRATQPDHHHRQALQPSRSPGRWAATDSGGRGKGERRRVTCRVGTIRQRSRDI